MENSMRWPDCMRDETTFDGAYRAGREHFGCLGAPTKLAPLIRMATYSRKNLRFYDMMTCVLEVGVDLCRRHPDVDRPKFMNYFRTAIRRRLRRARMAENRGSLEWRVDAAGAMYARPELREVRVSARDTGPVDLTELVETGEEWSWPVEPHDLWRAVERLGQPYEQILRLRADGLSFREMGEKIESKDGYASEKRAQRLYYEALEAIKREIQKILSENELAMQMKIHSSAKSSRDH